MLVVTNCPPIVWIKYYKTQIIYHYLTMFLLDHYSIISIIITLLLIFPTSHTVFVRVTLKTNSPMLPTTSPNPSYTLPYQMVPYQHKYRYLHGNSTDIDPISNPTHYFQTMDKFINHSFLSIHYMMA